MTVAAAMDPQNIGSLRGARSVHGLPPLLRRGLDLLFTAGVVVGYQRCYGTVEEVFFARSVNKACAHIALEARDGCEAAPVEGVHELAVDEEPDS